MATSELVTEALSYFAGIVVILAALVDVWLTLFQPSLHGRLSHAVVRLIWHAFRGAARLNQALLNFAGPAAVVGVILTWAGLLLAGWALIYWPNLPEAFTFASGLEPSEKDGLFTALYVSLVTLTTLGFGDITPTEGWLRILVAVQALVGFALLTASISWVLSIYPAVSRQRSLAHSIGLLRREAAKHDGHELFSIFPESTVQALTSLTSKFISVRNDLVQLPISYYFRSEEQLTALPSLAQDIVPLLQKAQEQKTDSVEVELGMLETVIDDFCGILSADFLNTEGAPPGEVLKRYAEDHMQPGSS